MSIVSKFLIVLIVVVSIAASVMISVYAFVQPNWKQHAEENRAVAEASGLSNLVSQSDKLITQPQSALELAVRDTNIRTLTKQVDEKDREIKSLKDSLTLAQTQFSVISEPLARLEQESKKYQDLLGKAQDEIRRLNVQTATLVSEKSAAEKLSTIREVERATLARKVEVLQNQNKSQEDRIQLLERGVMRLEKEREDMAVVVQQARTTVAGAGGAVASLGGGADGFLPGATGTGDGLGGLLTTTGKRQTVKLAEPVRIRGKLTEVKETGGLLYALINVGEDDNVALNQTLHVFTTNPPAYVGTLTVTRLDYQTAAGRLELLRADAKLDVGKVEYEVTNDLKTLR